MPRCHATKRDGKKCTKDAKLGECYCSLHIQMQTPRQTPEPSNVTYNTEKLNEEIDAINFALQVPIDKPIVEQQDKNLAISKLRQEPIECRNNELIMLRAENASLMKLVKQLLSYIHNPDNKGKIVGEKKPKNLTQKGILNKAKWMFYNEHKNDVDILEPIQERLNSVGVTVIPWQYVRLMTDQKFMSMSHDTMHQYLDRVRSMCFSDDRMVA